MSVVAPPPAFFEAPATAAATASSSSSGPDSEFTIVLAAETDPERRFVRGVPISLAKRCAMLHDVGEEDDEVVVPVLSRAQADSVVRFARETDATAEKLRTHKPVRSPRVSENVAPLEFAQAAAGWTVTEALVLVSAAKYLLFADLFEVALVRVACARFGECTDRGACAVLDEARIQEAKACLRLSARDRLARNADVSKPRARGGGRRQATPKRA